MKADPNVACDLGVRWLLLSLFNCCLQTPPSLAIENGDTEILDALLFSGLVIRTAENSSAQLDLTKKNPNGHVSLIHSQVRSMEFFSDAVRASFVEEGSRNSILVRSPR